MCTSLPFLRSGLHQRSVSIVLWSGCALADGVLFVLGGLLGLACSSSWGVLFPLFLFLLVVGCLAVLGARLGWVWSSCFGLAPFWIIARNARVLHSSELDGCFSLNCSLLITCSFHFFSLLLTLVRRLTGSPSGLTEAGCGSKKKPVAKDQKLQPSISLLVVFERINEILADNYREFPVVNQWQSLRKPV